MIFHYLDSAQLIWVQKNNSYEYKTKIWWIHFVWTRFSSILEKSGFSGNLRKNQTLCFLHRVKIFRRFFRRFPEISGDFRRRSMSSLGHQKMMKSEDVKIGNISISQSRCYLGCGKIWTANSQYPGKYRRWQKHFFYKKKCFLSGSDLDL